MPGKLGDLYETELMKFGGLSSDEAETFVKRIGKPFSDVYDIALQNNSDRSRVCMVGDALETDVTGGSMVGIETIWILKDGVYAPEFNDKVDDKGIMDVATKIIQDFNQEKETTYAKGLSDQLPTIAMSHFRW